MSPEVGLLLLCARPRLDADAVEEAERLLEGGVDLDAFSTLASLHGLAPLADALLREVDPGGQRGARARAEMHERLIGSAATHMNAAREACEVTRWLSDAGVESLVIKGPAMSGLYALGQRRYSDIDLLVRPTDFWGAREALLGHGYQQVGGPPGPLLGPFVALGSELTFGAPRRQAIDLHWRLGDPGYPFALGDESIWGPARSLDLPEGTLKTLGDEALLVYLCFHGARHLWVRLAWLADVARLLIGAPRLDWDRVGALAAHTRTRRILALGLVLLRDLLGLELCAPASRLVVAQPSAVALAKEVSDALAKRQGAAKHHSFLLRARERPEDKARYLLDVALRPTAHEWRGVALPAALYPAYSGYRLARLVGKYGRRWLDRARAAD